MLALAALALLPAAASAGSRQLPIFQDDGLLLRSGAAVRDSTLDEIRSLGATAIKAQLDWATVAPGGKTKPRGFDGSDPSDYPGWGTYDEFLSAAEARGFRVIFALSPPAPSWATRGKRGRYEQFDRPSAREYGRFAQAAAERFPSVDIWSFYNEPNLFKYLYPQARNGVPAAPHLYRDMVRAGVSGLRRAGAGGDTVLFGELLPQGSSSTGPQKNLRPLRFLREFFCLDSSYRAFSGRAAKLRGCGSYKRLSGLDGFAYHPYTRGGGPGVREISPDDATIRSLPRVTRVLDRARAKRRYSGGRLPVWITEFDFQSDPPDPNGSPLARIPGFMGLSELWLAQRNRRVVAYSQYTMNDTPGDAGLWQGGLRFANGRKKPGVYEAYRLPILARRLGASAVEIRGASRSGGRGSVVQVQSRAGSGAYRDLGSPVTVRNVRGYFSARFRVSNVSKRKFRFVAGDFTSPAVKAVTLF